MRCITPNARSICVISLVRCALLCLRALTICVIYTVLNLGTGDSNGGSCSSNRVTRYATALSHSSLDLNDSADLRALLFWYHSLHCLAGYFYRAIISSLIFLSSLVFVNPVLYLYMYVLHVHLDITKI